MRKTTKIYFNVISDSNDINELNELVDEAVIKEDYFDEDKTASDIGYEVLSCSKRGDAVLLATFTYD
jgi:hypothetical protein